MTVLRCLILIVGLLAGNFAHAFVDLTSFTISAAHDQSPNNVVEWQVSSETGTYGYFLERLDEATGDYVPVHEDMLPGFIQTQRGATYRLLDLDAPQRERQTYRLIEVETDNDRLVHGPFEVYPRAENAFLTGDVEPAARLKDDDIGMASLWDGGFARQRHEPSAEERAVWQAKRAEREKRAQAFEFNAQSTNAKRALNARKIILRISIDEDGFYQISSAEIAAAFGRDKKKIERWLKKGRFVLNSGGQDVAYTIADDNSALYFYGEGIDTRYTDTNVYQLSVSSAGSALLMTTLDASSDSLASSAASFHHITQWDENNIPATYLTGDPDGDYWYWEGVSSRNPPVVIDALDAPGSIGDGLAFVALELRGGTEMAPGLSDHHVEVSLNGTKIGDGYFDGFDRYRFEGWFEQGFNGAPVVSLTGNRIEINAALDPGISDSLFWLDRIELGYQRAFEAEDDRLRFVAEETDTITVRGFNSEDLTLLDTSDPQRPVILTGTVVGESSGYSISFRPSNPGGTYFVTATADSPKSLVSDTLSKLRKTKNKADFVVIAPYALRNGAQALADLRKAKRLKTQVVDLQDIYNEFSNGITDAYAIRAFLDYAYHNWKRPPRYIVLAGKGTLDPRDFLGYGTNVIPVVLADSSWNLFSSDNRYADVVGDDGVPEMAIGRIPALTDNELLDYVEKLAGQNLTAGPGSWLDRVVMVADRYPDPGGDFPGYAESIIEQFPANVIVERHYYQGEDNEIFKTALKSAINSGAGLINYAGHGGVTQLGKDDLFNNQDVADLTNFGALPVLFALTCTVGWDSFPGVDSLAGKLLLNPVGGVSGAVAPASLSFSREAFDLNQAFAEAFIVEPGVRMGDALLHALEDLANRGGPRFLIDAYSIIGDPATIVPVGAP